MQECGRTDQEVEKQLLAARNRRVVLARERPPRITALVDELALHRLVGGPDIVRRQLEHLLEWARAAHLGLRVLPNRAHVAAMGAFSVIRPRHGPPVAFLDTLTSSLFLEHREETRRYLDAAQGLNGARADRGRVRRTHHRSREPADATRKRRVTGHAPPRQPGLTPRVSTSTGAAHPSCDAGHGSGRGLNAQVRAHRSGASPREPG